ncbi:hypothetical protein QBC43DRAFT_334912 [Cladorrhinum sp. PSN259]|nr:hypothetical protein QBC43DRAFT_334912 [Cladorrhinum sp. PSN259]
MRTQTLLALGGATLTVANILGPQITAAPALARRQTESIMPNPSLTSECSSSISSLLSVRPTIEGDLYEWWISERARIESTSTVTKSTSTNYVSLCSQVLATPQATLPSPPSSLAGEYSSFTSAWTSYLSSARPDIRSVASKCAGVGDDDIPYAGYLLWEAAENVKECLRAVEIFYGQYYGEYTGSLAPSGYTGVYTGPLPSTTGGSDAGNNGNGGAVQSTTGSTGGGAAEPRETGYVAKMAVAAVGAIVGAAAL